MLLRSRVIGLPVVSSLLVVALVPVVEMYRVYSYFLCGLLVGLQIINKQTLFGF